MKWGNMFKVTIIVGIILSFFLVGFSLGFARVINMSIITRGRPIIPTIMEAVIGK